VPDVSPLRNVKFRMPLTFTAAKVFVNIFSRKYYFANNLRTSNRLGWTSGGRTGRHGCLEQIKVFLDYKSDEGELRKGVTTLPDCRGSE